MKNRLTLFFMVLCCLASGKLYLQDGGVQAGQFFCATAKALTNAFARMQDETVDGKKRALVLKSIGTGSGLLNGLVERNRYGLSSDLAKMTQAGVAVCDGVAHVEEMQKLRNAQLELRHGSHHATNEFLQHLYYNETNQANNPINRLIMGHGNIPQSSTIVVPSGFLQKTLSYALIAGEWLASIYIISQRNKELSSGLVLADVLRECCSFLQRVPAFNHGIYKPSENVEAATHLALGANELVNAYNWGVAAAPLLPVAGIALLGEPSQDEVALMERLQEQGVSAEHAETIRQGRLFSRHLSDEQLIDIARGITQLEEEGISDFMIRYLLQQRRRVTGDDLCHLAVGTRNLRIRGVEDVSRSVFRQRPTISGRELEELAHNFDELRLRGMTVAQFSRLLDQQNPSSQELSDVVRVSRELQGGGVRAEQQRRLFVDILNQGDRLTGERLRARAQERGFFVARAPQTRAPRTRMPQIRIQAFRQPVLSREPVRVVGGGSQEKLDAFLDLQPNDNVVQALPQVEQDWECPICREQGDATRSNMMICRGCTNPCHKECEGYGVRNADVVHGCPMCRQEAVSVQKPWYVE